MSSLIKIKPIVATDPKWWMEPLNQLILMVNQLITGHVNSVGTVKLTSGSATTTLMDNSILRGSTIVFSPQTADAASVFASLWYDPASIPATGGQVTLHSTSTVAADLTFAYAVFT